MCQVLFPWCGSGGKPSIQSAEAVPRHRIGRWVDGLLRSNRPLPGVIRLSARLLDWPRTGDEDVHESPGALLPVGTGGHVGDADQRAE